MLKKFWNSLNKKNDNTNEEIIEKDDLKAEEENLENANTDEDINIRKDLKKLMKVKKNY